MPGCREVLADPSWTAEVRWSDRKGFHRSGHRPIAVTLNGARVAIEVEVARKSVERLKAIVGLHARWKAAGKTTAVIYIRADQALDGLRSDQTVGACDGGRGHSAESGEATARLGPLLIRRVSMIRCRAA
jgi:hypothetical protein